MALHQSAKLGISAERNKQGSSLGVHGDSLAVWPYLGCHTAAGELQIRHYTAEIKKVFKIATPPLNPRQVHRSHTTFIVTQEAGRH